MPCVYLLDTSNMIIAKTTNTKALKHEIGVIWYHCDLCDHKCKHKCNLKRHKANIHEIGVVWYPCDLCDYKCKQKGDLKKHKGQQLRKLK